MMKISKKKVLIGIPFVGLFVALVFYLSLSPIKQNLVKKKLLHITYILNPDWTNEIVKTNNNGYVKKLRSSTLLVDDIFPSMQGPYAKSTFLIEDKEEELFWITGLKVNANTKFKSQEDSNDFVCHVNLYHSEVEHFARMGMDERINLQILQLITLTKGELDFEFPKGFGYPIFSNEKIFLSAQALNLNEEDAFFKINYDFDLSFHKNKEKRLRPLYMRYVVVSLVYDDKGVDSSFTADAFTDSRVQCVIAKGDNHGLNGLNNKGEPVTSFWKVPKGKHTYRSNIKEYIKLDTIMTLHKINSHVHPFSTSLELRDITADSTVFKSLVINKKDKIGIKKITSFSSENGIKLYPDHDYELVQEVNNTTKGEIQMMGSMFLYFYDYKLDKKIDLL